MDFNLQLKCLSTPEGHAHACLLLQKELTFDCHDYWVTDICEAIDGWDFVGVTTTGGGKLAIFLCNMLLLKAFVNGPVVAMAVKNGYPKNTAMVVVPPTKGLAIEMVHLQ